MTKHYSKGDITVVWKPDLCIHSTVCWKGLSEVFNPKVRPWVNMEGADEARIIEQVSHCPSGALSYVMNNKETMANDTTEEVNTAMEVMKNGPLIVYGNITLKDAKGQEHHKNRVTAFCRCGASANKPFCDGSHIRIGFKDEQ
ncbi:MAG: hypothetical protein JWQ38_3009 [Flavipsychrobacter sp.]|nr:hypothetical protein [Flavipsychrobacter sp.]